jgi:hypothetical protein
MVVAMVVVPAAAPLRPGEVAVVVIVAVSWVGSVPHEVVSE